MISGGAPGAGGSSIRGGGSPGAGGSAGGSCVGGAGAGGSSCGGFRAGGSSIGGPGGVLGGGTLGSGGAGDGGSRGGPGGWIARTGRTRSLVWKSMEPTRCKGVARIAVPGGSARPGGRETPGTADAQARSMDILTWLIVGLVAGVLASLVVGGSGYGIIGDIVIGIVGAFLGGFVFREAGWAAPWGGLAGTIFVAFIGAVLLLVVIHLVRRGSRRGA